MRLVHGSKRADFHGGGAWTHSGNGPSGDTVGKDKRDDEVEDHKFSGVVIVHFFSSSVSRSIEITQKQTQLQTNHQTYPRQSRQGVDDGQRVDYHHATLDHLEISSWHNQSNCDRGWRAWLGQIACGVVHENIEAGYLPNGQ